MEILGNKEKWTMTGEMRVKISEPPVREKRIAMIEAALRNGGDQVHHVPFRDGYIDAPVAAVNPAALVYRAANGRLFSELVALGAPREQLEDRAQQQMLHDLLIEKAKDLAGPIYDELERHSKQTEPLLVAHDGIVVNGNRRLAAMRELRTLDTAAEAVFEYVSIAVLPPTFSAEDIEYVEAALQMAPELKLDYSWINRRLKLRDQVERRGVSDSEILAAYRFDEPSTIDRELAQLSLAEHYLRYCGQPGAYTEVAEHKELFIAMHRELDAFENKRVTELWTYGGFAILNANEEIGQSPRQYFPFTSPVPFAVVHWGMRSLGEEFELAAPQPTGENRPVTTELFEQLITIVREVGRAPEIASRLIMLSDRLRAHEREEIGAAQTLTALRQANRNLQMLDPANVSSVQAREIRAELLALDDYLSMFSPPSDRAGQANKKPRSMFAKLWQGK